MAKSKKSDKKTPPKKKTNKVDKKIEKLEAQVDSLTEDVKRGQADFINFKRRSEAEKQASRNYGKREAVIQLLPVLDTLERALNYLPDDLADNEWAQGIQKAAKQLESQLESMKVTKINSIDVAFNPERHEAVAVDDGDGDEEVVIEVMQTGYEFEDIVIRPAMVKVGRK